MEGTSLQAMNTLMHYHNMIMCDICTFLKWDVIFGEMLRMILGEGEKSIKPERSLAGWADTFTAGSPVIKATSEQLTSFTFTKQFSRRNISVSVAADSEKLNRLTQPHSLVIITQRNALANRLASWLGYIHHIRHTDAHFINSLSYAVRLQ